MHLSTTTTILSLQEPIIRGQHLFLAMDKLAKAGFRTLDINLSTQANPGFPLAEPGWEDWAYRVRERAEALGLRCLQAHSFHYKTRESTGNHIDRPWYEERFRRSIVAARILGVKTLVTHPCDFFMDSVYDGEKTLRFNQTYWAPFVDLALKNGVDFAFENLFPFLARDRFCSRAEELIALVDSFGDERVGICWDTGHANLARQKQEEALKAIGRRLKATHVHDNTGIPRMDEHNLPYTGSVPWTDIYRALNDIKYDGCFSMEVKSALWKMPPGMTDGMLAYLYQLGMQMLRLAEGKGGESL